MLLILLGLIAGQSQFVKDSDNHEKIEITKGQELALLDENSDGIINWSSENEKIAVVDENGTVIAKKTGTTTIIVETEDGKIEYEIVVTEPSEETDATVPTEEKTEIPDNNMPVLYIENVSAKAGDKEIPVKVNVKGNPGILGMIISINYDDKNLVLKEASCGEAVDGVLNFTKSNDFASGCRFVWDGVEITEGQIEDGTILELTFEAYSSIKSGKYPIEIGYGTGDIVNGKLIEVEPEIVNGNIIIE